MVKLMGSPSRLVSGYTLYLGTGSRVRRISVSGEDQLSCAWSAREATCSSDHGDPFRAADARGRRLPFCCRPPHLSPHGGQAWMRDRKSTRLNSSHVAISYAVFCLKKKNNNETISEPE